MAKKKVYGLTEQTMARVKELIQVNPTGPVNGVDTSSGRQVAWVTITGAQIASGTLATLWPCAVELMNTAGRFVEFGYAACYPTSERLRKIGDNPPGPSSGVSGWSVNTYKLQVGRRYLAVREKSIDGMGVFRVLNEPFYSSARSGYLGTANRRDGFSGGVYLSGGSFTSLPFSGGSSVTGLEISDAWLTVPVPGWYDVDFRINLSLLKSDFFERYKTEEYEISCLVYRVNHTTGARIESVYPFVNSKGVVVRHEPTADNADNRTIGGACGSATFRATLNFPSDEMSLRVALTPFGSGWVGSAMSWNGSITATWAGPQMIGPAPPSGGAGVTTGEAIADGEPVSGTDYEYTLDGSDSYAPPGETITDYDWSVACPDASTVTGSGSTFSYDYTAKGAGSYTATLTVTFSGAGTDTDTHNFTLPNPSPPANGTLTVNLFSDLNGDGDKDLGEGNVAGRYILVELVGTPGENGYLDITDADGNASGSLPPGDYLVSVWPASLYEGEYVTTTPIPYPATVTSSNTTNVAIGISTVGDLPLPGAPTYTMGAEASTFTVTGSASGLTPGEA